jgi:Xaa-Pro aminopeptidase
MGVAEQRAVAVLKGALEASVGAGRRVGIDMPNLSAFFLAALGDRFETVDIHPDMLQLESRKDKLALEAIIANEGLNDDGFTAAQQAIRPGATELEVYVAIQGRMTLAVGHPFVLTGGFVSGERAWSASGSHPTPRPLRGGDLFIIDLYPTVRGYRADTTRTFVVGEPSEEQLRLHSVLEETLLEVEKAIKPGALCKNLNTIVRGVIASHGYGEYFTHHTGHGIGLFTPEPPYIEDSTPVEPALEAGNVIAIEPGIYIPGVAGMRLEENYLVTDEGFERLSGFPRKLIACPG